MRKACIVVVVVIFLLSLVLIGAVALHEVEGRSERDPSGTYRAVVSFHNYKTWLARAPGDSGGKSGYVTIYDKTGVSHGKIPVEMIDQLSDLRWTDTGARIPAYCEWDFRGHTYRYWNASQTHETIKNTK